MYRSLFTRDVFAELDRLQRVAQQVFDISPGIRGFARGGFPAINIVKSPKAVDLYCFVPGIDPGGIEVKLEKGVLSIAGERKHDSRNDERASVHINERFTGRFHRVVSLPDDIDANALTATCRDGVLHITAPRREAVQPRHITIQ